MKSKRICVSFRKRTSVLTLFYNNRKGYNCYRMLLMMLMCICFPVMLSGQTRMVKGRVVDVSGEPLTGATVHIVGKSGKGTVTDMDGNYSISVSGETILQFSFIGYKTKALNVPKGKNVLNVALEEDVIMLDQTVVVAMDMRREEKSLSTAYQKLNVDDMVENRDANFLNSLSGKVAGLQVISNGPSGSTSVIIRGMNSITGNNQPLYVIDGVPIINNMGENGDLDYGNPANSINPDDIESMVVLKGANASALYGSDAANGAIVITTKKASRAEKKGWGATFSTNLQFTDILQFPIYQNVYGVGANGRLNFAYNVPNNTHLPYDPSLPYGLARLTYGGYGQRSQGLPMLGFDIVGRNGQVKQYVPNPENVTDMYKVGHTWTNTITLEKRADVASTRLSYTHIGSNDVLDKFNDLSRHMLNLRSNVKMNKILDLGINVRYTNEHMDNRGFKNASNRNPLYVAAWMPRDVSLQELIPWKNADGTSVTFPGGFYNPYWLLNELSNEDEKNWILSDVTLNFKITKDLKIRLKGALDFSSSKGWVFTNMYTPFDTDGEYQEFSDNYKNLTYEALLSYNKRWKKWNLSASLGATSSHYRRNRQNSAVYTLLQPDVPSLANNGATARTWQVFTNRKKQAIFGTASLGYRDFIYLDLTGRNDWTSTLPAGNRSYFYSSAGVSFILTEAFKNIPKNILSFAKLRASFASVGNDTGFDMLLNSYSYGNTYLGDMPWFQSDRYKKNARLKPESTISYELGMDLKFWNNRIGADITFYTKKTNDQIMRSKVSTASGYSELMRNAGTVKNWGTELSLSITPVKNRNFDWTAHLNWAKNNSEIVSLPDGMEYMQLSKYNSAEVRIVKGRPYGTLYSNGWKRDKQGNVLVDLNGRPIETQGVLLGDIAADWIGGFRNSFRWKDFSASVLIDFKKGGKLWSATSFNGARDGQTIASLQGRDEYLFSSLILGEDDKSELKGFLDPKYTVNPNANLTNNAVKYHDSGRPKGVRLPNAYFDASTPWGGEKSNMSIKPQNFWTDNANRNAELFVYDASYIKLREVSIGYTFPKKVLQKIGCIQSLKISAVGRNLAILYQNTPKGIDPEATSTTGNAQGVENGFSLPTATYGFDIKLTF